MNNDYALAAQFLASLGAPKGQHTFVFAKIDDPADHETFEEMKFEQLQQLIAPKQVDGYMLYVQVEGGAYLSLPGLLDLRKTPPVLQSLEAVQLMLEGAKVSKMGEWSPNAGGSSGGGSESEVTVALPVAAHHRTYLNVRGLTDTTIDAAGVGTMSDKKAISKLLGRSTWGSGSVLVFNHKLEAGGNVAAQRLVLDNPSNPTASVLWTSARPTPYFPEQALADGRYDTDPGPVYVALDEVDALVLTQLGYKAIGGDSIDAFIDHQHFTDVGEEVPHPSIVKNLGAVPEWTILCYPKLQGKKRTDAHKLARVLKEAGASQIHVLEVKDGNLRKVAEDLTAFKQLENYRATVSDAEIASPYASLREALGDVVLNDPAFEGAKGLLIPDKYEIRADGCLYTYLPGPVVNGIEMRKEVLVSRTLVVPVALVRAFETGELSVMVAHYYDGQWRRRHLPMAYLARKNAIAGLANWGIHATDHNSMEMIGWFHDFLEVNDQHQRIQTINGFRRTGWHENSDGTWLFAFPGHARTNGTFERPTGEEDGNAIHFRMRTEKRGTRDNQVKYLREIVKHPNGRILTTACLTACLLERIPGATSRMVHSFGLTTGGKTLFSVGALGIFGPPHRMMLKGAATIAGLEGYLSAFSGTFVVIDEITTKDEEQMSEMLYTIIDGKSKMRGSRTGGTRETHEWKAIVNTTAEKPLTGKDTHQGATARVMNLHMEPQTTEYLTELGELVSNNYGHLRDEWIDYIHTLDFDQVIAASRAYIKEGRLRARDLNMNARNADFISDLRTGHKFIYPLFGALLGLPDDDGRGLVETLEGVNHLRTEIVRDQDRALGALQTYVMLNPGGVGMFNDPDPPRSSNVKIYARRRVADGKVCFERGWINEFLAERGFNGTHIRQRWIAEGITAETQLRRGSHLRPYYTIFPWDLFDDSVSTTPHAPTREASDAN